MKKQTAVQYLIEQLFPKALGEEQYYHIEIAKAMERQQIIDAYVNGNHSEMRGGKVIHSISEQYYTETFTEPKND
jgi:hypothetical protein